MQHEAAYAPKQYAEQNRQQFAQRMQAQGHPLDRAVHVSPEERGSVPYQAVPQPPGPSSPVETVLYATAELTGQVERLMDELHARLSRAGVIQDVPVNTAQISELPPPSCPLMSQLLEYAGRQERLSLQLQTLLQQLAL